MLRLTLDTLRRVDSPQIQFLSCVDPWTLHKVAKYVSIFNRWPRSYIINEPPRILLSVGIIIFHEAKNFKSLKVSASSYWI